MAFSFAVQPQDYALRAQAGLSLDPSMGDPALTAQAQQVAAAPVPAQAQPVAVSQGAISGGVPDIKVSPAEAIMSWLAHGGTPAEAAQQARAVKVANFMSGVQMRQALTQQQILQSLATGIDGDGPATSQAASPAPSANFNRPAPVGAAQPPARAGLSPRAMTAFALINPQGARALAEIQKVNGEVALGPNGEVYRKYDPSILGKRFGNPTNINGTIVDVNDPDNINRAVPAPPVAGAMPVYNNRGEVVDWQLPAGAQAAIAAAQAPTIEHNRAMERIDSANATTNRVNAGTGAGRLGYEQGTNPNWAPPPGFVIGHPGALRHGR